MGRAQVKKNDGRESIRLDIPEKSGDLGYFDEIERILDEKAWVLSYQLNPVKGTIVLDYDRQIDLEKELLESFDWWYKPTHEHHSLGVSFIRFASSGYRRLDRLIKNRSGGYLDASTVFAGLLAGGVLIQMKRSKFLPAGFTLFMLILTVLQNESRRSA